MGAAQHKLSRRALLAGACAGAALPFSRRSGLDPESTFSSPPPPERWTPDHVRGDEGGHVERWAKALARFARAEAEVPAAGADEAAFDRACGRHDAVLARLLGAPAPDGEAAAWKLALIDEHRVFELDCWDAAIAALQADLRRLAAPASS
ncbi:MAG TPA: hypothetical protein VGW34_14360 [Allosphingosinicella sp.]|nr:hypothetical protein [Allosphingosinicella sp.]